MYSLVTGAAATGVNRSTILRAIKAGRLSAERDGSGAWVIQPVELHRLFLHLPQLPAVVEPVQNAGHGTEAALLRTLLRRCGPTFMVAGTVVRSQAKSGGRLMARRLPHPADSQQGRGWRRLAG
jgi:hypothetical protein